MQDIEKYRKYLKDENLTQEEEEIVIAEFLYLGQIFFDIWQKEEGSKNPAGPLMCLKKGLTINTWSKVHLKQE